MRHSGACHNLKTDFFSFLLCEAMQTSGDVGRAVPPSSGRSSRSSRSSMSSRSSSSSSSSSSSRSRSRSRSSSIIVLFGPTLPAMCTSVCCFAKKFSKRMQALHRSLFDSGELAVTSLSHSRASRLWVWLYTSVKLGVCLYIDKLLEKF